jgi:uncharacterized protein YlxW (UPF0749 family)
MAEAERQLHEDRILAAIEALQGHVSASIREISDRMEKLSDGHVESIRSSAKTEAATEAATKRIEDLEGRLRKQEESSASLVAKLTMIVGAVSVTGAGLTELIVQTLLHK